MSKEKIYTEEYVESLLLRMKRVEEAVQCLKPFFIHLSLGHHYSDIQKIIDNIEKVGELPGEDS